MNVRFLSQLDARRTLEGWTLLSELRALVEREGLERAFIVPAGFQTDFASIPRLPFVYLVFGDTAHQAATLHDFLYSGGADSTGAGCNRAEADAIFGAAMRADGVPWWRRAAMVAGVRLFGWTSYRRLK